MIFEKIRKIIADTLEINENDITLDTSFKDLEIDSLQFFQIIIDIEEAFEVQIEDADCIGNVKEAVDFVKRIKEE